MSEKIISINDHINKKDLEVILEVNKKAIEIETEMVGQNEEIIILLKDNKEKQIEIYDYIEKLYKQSEENSKDLFKIQVLFLTGLISLVVQVINIFVRK